MLILSFYLVYYDFLLYIFLYFCVVNTAIFFHFKFLIFQCSVRGQEKGRYMQRGGGRGGVSSREQRSRARSRRGGVSENWTEGSLLASLFFLTAIAIAIATRPFKFHEISVSYTSSSFVSSIHSLASVLSSIPAN